MATLLERGRLAIASAWASIASAHPELDTIDDDADGDRDGRADGGRKQRSTTRNNGSMAASRVDELMTFSTLSAATLRSMGAAGQLLRMPIAAGADPPSLVSAKLAWYRDLENNKVHTPQHQTPSAASAASRRPPTSSSSTAGAASFSFKLDLPSHLGGPGMLGFLTSRWFLAIMVVTALINRINHICRPRVRPQPVTGWKRVALKLPAVVLLTKSMVTLLGICFMLIDISRQYASMPYASQRLANVTSPPLGPNRPPAPVGTLAKSVARVLPADWADRAWFGDLFINPVSGEYRIEARSSASIWAAFLAAAVVVVTEALIKSLEGGREHEMPSFNLAGFAYVTHAYVFSPDSERGYPGSPTWNLFFSIFLQVAELWTLCIASLTKSRPRTRLPITTVFGIVSTVHHLHWRYVGNPTDPLHIMNRFPDAILLGIILLTAILHALTMAVTEGHIDFSRLLFNASNLPSMTEDYNLALFKLGTACLESTRLSGMSRELASVRTPKGTWIEMDASGAVQVVGGAAQSGRLGAGSFFGLGSGNLRQRSRAIAPGLAPLRNSSTEDGPEMIVRRRRRRLGASQRDKDDDGRQLGLYSDEDSGSGEDSHSDASGVPADGSDSLSQRRRIAELSNGLALEIRDLRTAATGAIAGRSSFALLSGTDSTRMAEARRFTLTLARVLVSLATLLVAATWSWLPLVLRRPIQRRVFRPVRTRARRSWRWMRRILPRYLRLLWHGQMGEERREGAIRARRLETERSARGRAARILLPASTRTENDSSRPLAESEETESGLGRPTASSTGLEREVAWRRAMRALSPSSGASDVHYWRTALAPDAPPWEDESSDEDGEWQEEEDDDVDEEPDALALDASDDASAQLAERARRLSRRSPSVGLDELNADDVGVADDDDGLALVLAAQTAAAGPDDLLHQGDLQGPDMSQVLLAHMSHGGSSPLTRTRFRHMFGASASSAAQSTPDRAFNRTTSDSPWLSVGFASPSGQSRRGLEQDAERDALVDVIRLRRGMAVRALAESSGSSPVRAPAPFGEEEDEEQRAEWERERQRLCVICQTEHRTILIWPCRCLALCEECRDNLASRPVGGKVQSCPCCRTPVAGFSRLFLP